MPFHLHRVRAAGGDTIQAQEEDPPPVCENNTKVPKFDGNNTECCSDRGGVLATGGGGGRAPFVHRPTPGMHNLTLIWTLPAACSLHKATNHFLYWIGPAKTMVLKKAQKCGNTGSLCLDKPALQHSWGGAQGG